VALAEQGATVTGIDLDDPALNVARQRAGIYGLSDKITLQYANAMELDKVYKEGQFDVAIFFASIEHMTHHERIASLKAAWKVLKTGGVLCILGTPNRLWFYDVHTAFLPFNMWLPDDLAFAHSSFSPRENYKEFSKRDYKESEIEFLRWGRGVSYHELEVAIKPATQLEVIGDLHSFQRPKTWLQGLSYRRSDDYLYKRILANNGPKNLAPGFYEYYLDIAIRKNG
jgi:S-adenosylmethionine-dependent methyltransferase